MTEQVEPIQASAPTCQLCPRLGNLRACSRCGRTTCSDHAVVWQEAAPNAVREKCICTRCRRKGTLWNVVYFVMESMSSWSW